MSDLLAPDLALAPAHRLAALVHRGEVSPVELVEGFAERIDRLNGALGAVVTLDVEGARAQAHQAQEAQAAQRRSGAAQAPPLLGLPVLVKDSQATQGLRTTLATRAWSGWVPREDAAVVARLRAAGCVVLGKTNLCELGTEPVTEPELFGPTRNPWDLARSPGGSSGGSAAALAAGLAPVVTASDGAGSIRIPAAHTGLFGLKPTRGRVTNGPHGTSGLLGLSSPGPLTRDVADAAQQLDAMAGPLPGDLAERGDHHRPFAAAVAHDPAPRRVGVLADAVLGPLEPARAEAVRRTADRLSDLGHHVEEISLTLDEQVMADFTLVWAASVAALPLPAEELEPLNAWLAAHAAAHDAPALAGAVSRLQRRARRVAALHEDLDVVCAPTVAQPPPEVGAGAGLDPAERFAQGAAAVGLPPLANLTGQPAASVPAGVDAHGLPCGVMLMAPAGDEATLLAVAAQLQRDRDWSAQHPPLAA